MKTVAIVLTYNNSETIEACIASVVGQVEHVIVVDNASEDDTVEKAGAFSNVTIMRRDRNYGTGSRNMAIQFATEKFNPDFMVLDPDAIFPPNAVRMMIERLGGEPGVVAARMEKGPKYPIRHDSLFYSFVLFERRVFEKVGLYEPALFAYYDDPFVGTKVLRAGFPIFNEPSFAYIHVGMYSTRQIRGLRSYMRMRNWFLYNRLTGTRLRTFLLHPFRASRNLAAAIQLGGAKEFQLSFLGYISGMILLLSRGKHDRMKRIAEPLMSYKLCLQ